MDYFGGHYFGGHYFGPAAAGAQGGGLIRRALAAALTSDATLAGLFAGKIRPLAPRQKDPAPGLTYEVTKNAPVWTLDGPLGKSEATLVLTARSKDYSDTEAAIERLRNMFDGLRGRLGGLVDVDRTRQLDEADAREVAADGSDLGTFSGSVTYSIRYRQPKPTR